MGLAWSFDRFRATLSNRTNASMLGSGAYGAVYQLNKKTNRVLKVCGDHTDGWPVYAHWLMTQAQYSPHYLEVYSIREVNADNPRLDTFTIASIEKLFDLRKANKEGCGSYYPVDISTGRNQPSVKAKWNGEEVHVPGYIFEQIEMIMECQYDIRNHIDCHTPLDRNSKKFMRKYPELYEALYLLLEFSLETECNMDLHRGNVMYRPSTGHLVITDPFAECRRRKKTAKIFRPRPKKGYETDYDYQCYLEEARREHAEVKPYYIGRVRYDRTKKSGFRIDRYGQYSMF